MGLQSLNQLRHVRTVVLSLRNVWLRLRHGIRLPASSTISTSGRIVSGRRASVAIGEETLVAFKTLLITHDRRTGETRPISIGRRCFIGGGATIMPGVTIGDESIVGGGSVVFDDVPPRTIVAGNPARVIRREIEVGKHGRLKGADEAGYRWQK